MSDARFPGAPPGSYVSEEGWLVVGDEAWTEHEWRLLWSRLAAVAIDPDPRKHQRRYRSRRARLEARRLARRNYMRRRRACL